MTVINEIPRSAGEVLGDADVIGNIVSAGGSSRARNTAFARAVNIIAIRAVGAGFIFARYSASKRVDDAVRTDSAGNGAVSAIVASCTSARAFRVYAIGGNKTIVANSHNLSCG